MCNHDENKQTTCLTFLDFHGHEIYMCECGALIDIADKKNYSEPFYPMTPEELRMLLNDIFAPIKKFVENQQELDKTISVLQSFPRKV